MDAETLIKLIHASDMRTGVDLASAFADEFRAGADLRGLLPLLASDEPDLVGLGVWIASEVADETRGREIFSELSKLLRHPAFSVRFQVMRALARLVRPHEHDVLAQLLGLLVDEDPGLWHQAIVAIAEMPDSRFLDLRGPWRSRVRLLLSSCSKDDLLESLRSGDELARRLAVVGALRHHADDAAFIETVRSLSDDEVQDYVAKLMEHFLRCR